MYPISHLQSSNFLTFQEPKNRCHGINSTSLCRLTDRYDNPLPTRFPIDWGGGGEENEEGELEFLNNLSGARNRVRIGLPYRPQAT